MTPLSGRIPPYAALLVGLLGLFVVSPVIPVHRASFVAELLFDLVLLAGVYSVGPSRHRWPFVALTLLTLGVRWGQQLTGTGSLDVTALAMTAVWLFYAIVIIVGHLFQQRDATLNTILGAIVAYLLTAAAFALVFEMIELQRPGAFTGIANTTLRAPNELSSAFSYFSLVCLTTMGYGDVVPVSSLARPIAALEGAFGQLYLAVMIARLVGLNIARGRGANYRPASEGPSG